VSTPTDYLASESVAALLVAATRAARARLELDERLDEELRSSLLVLAVAVSQLQERLALEHELDAEGVRVPVAVVPGEPLEQSWGWTAHVDAVIAAADQVVDRVVSPAVQTIPRVNSPISTSSATPSSLTETTRQRRSGGARWAEPPPSSNSRIAPRCSLTTSHWPSSSDAARSSMTTCSRGPGTPPPCGRPGSFASLTARSIRNFTRIWAQPERVSPAREVGPEVFVAQIG
jgi:hypothetical protein